MEDIERSKWNLFLNYLKDCTKKKVNRFERAKLIKEYLRVFNKSVNRFAKEEGFKKNTVQDWLLVAKIDQTDYNKLLGLGFTETDIYRSLRDNTHKKLLKSDENVFKINKFHLLVKHWLRNANNIEFEEIDVLNDLINDLNRLISRIEFNKKHGGG